MVGWGLDGVVDLLEFRQMLAEEKLEYRGKPLRDVVFVYCVGSRTTYTAVTLHELEEKKEQTVNQYHLYRDIRTYGSYETVYEDARHSGALFLRWEPDSPPVVEKADGRLMVRVKDTLDGGEEIEIGADLVVLERQAE